jgi:predicted DNA-binding transcriptional regulator YafY
MDSWQLIWWLMAQGPGIEVTAPVALRQKVSEQLAEATNLYSKQVS